MLVDKRGHNLDIFFLYICLNFECNVTVVIFSRLDGVAASYKRRIKRRTLAELFLARFGPFGRLVDLVSSFANDGRTDIPASTVEMKQFSQAKVIMCHTCEQSAYCHEIFGGCEQ